MTVLQLALSDLQLENSEAIDGTRGLIAPFEPCLDLLSLSLFGRVDIVNESLEGMKAAMSDGILAEF